MLLTFESRPSTSPFVERVWRCQSHTLGGAFHSMAEGNLELVITHMPSAAMVTLRGPVTRAVSMACPPNGHWTAIRFRIGTYFQKIPTALLMNHSDLNFAVTSDKRFSFEGRTWRLPTYENAEVFVDRLARVGSIALEPTVQGAIRGDRQATGLRSVQRRFLHVVGMSHARFQQVERARDAAERLRSGASILDVIHDSGYFDQAHLGRALKRWIGVTPATIAKERIQLSFSYKTNLTLSR